jgi:hypothetical protein
MVSKWVIEQSIFGAKQVVVGADGMEGREMPTRKRRQK